MTPYASNLDFEAFRKAVETKCCEYLLDRLGIAPQSAALKSPLAELLNGAVQVEGGSEHLIALPSRPELDRVYKYTFGNNFGLSLRIYPR